VFVEVRARKDARHGTPAETVGALKQRRIVHAARHYLVKRRVVDRACRFDVVAIEGDTVTHFENAFETT
jgi:putative endonuclease